MLVSLGALLVAGALGWFALRPTAAGPKSGKPAAAKFAAKKPAGAKTGLHLQKGRGQKKSRRAANTDKPTFDAIMEDKEVALSAEFKALLEEVCAAIDAEDKPRLVKVVRRMQDMHEWPDGLPKSLHLAAIEALQWFGVSVASELIGYLGSANAEVVESAQEAMIDALSDLSISDHERSDLLLKLVRVVNDQDVLDTMIMELDKMRPTVRAKTGMAIFESGNKAAAGILKENIDFYFGDMDDLEVANPGDLKLYYEKAEKAYAEDPDLAESDEEFYGGDKEDT